MKFTKKQIDRYSRQIILKKIGVIGQKKLLKSRVLIVGAGGLGSPIAIYLAASGVGKIGIIDKDNVEISNLNRQIIFASSDIKKSKFWHLINKKIIKSIYWKKNIQIYVFILSDIYLLIMCQFSFGIIIEFYKSIQKIPNERRIP